MNLRQLKEVVEDLLIEFDEELEIFDVELTEDELKIKFLDITDVAPEDYN